MALLRQVVVDEDLGISINSYDDGNKALEHRCLDGAPAVTVFNSGTDGATLSCPDCGLIGRVQLGKWTGY